MLNLKLLKEIHQRINLRRICKDTPVKYEVLKKRIVRGAPDLTNEESKILTKAIKDYCKAHIKNSTEILNKLK